MLVFLSPTYLVGKKYSLLSGMERNGDIYAYARSQEQLCCLCMPHPFSSRLEEDLCIGTNSRDSHSAAIRESEELKEVGH